MENSNQTKKKQRKGNSSILDILESWVKILGVLFSALALIGAYFSYTASEKWKVNEMISNKYKEFSENKSVMLAQGMLDYSVDYINLYGRDSMIKVTHEIILTSLVVDTINNIFSPRQKRIRDVFDEYFDQLSHFNLYVKAQLMTYDEIRPYFIYYISIIMDPDNEKISPELRKVIWDYLNFYKYSDVIELCENLLPDKIIKPKTIK